MIIQLQGGLGNQMFQYAYGRSLAIDRRQDLILDLSFLNDRKPRQNFTYREFELSCFRINAEVIDKLPLWVKLKNQSPSRLSKLIPGQIITERKYSVSTVQFNHSKNIYLSGLWQSPKYFMHNWDYIKNDFRLLKQISTESKAIQQQIKQSNAVSIHVRRGDYLGKPLHHVCPPEYYQNAILTIEAIVKDPVYFIFSDDIQWCRDNLKFISDHLFVDQAGRPHYEDMLLMSQCHHNIIANSTYSWWGTWLNEHKDKLVYYPYKWFNKSGWEIDDLIPENWIEIKY